MATPRNIQHAANRLFDHAVGARSNGAVSGRPLTTAEKAAFERIARNNFSSAESKALMSAGVSSAQATALLREMDRGQARDNPLSVEARARVQHAGDLSVKSISLIDEAKRIVANSRLAVGVDDDELEGLSDAESELSEARHHLDHTRAKLLSVSHGRSPAGHRDNAGVMALALALPNPGGWDVPPPDLDFIRRNSTMAKRHVSQETLDNLARGRAIRAANLAAQQHRDNISSHGAFNLVRRGQAEFYTPPTKNEKGQLVNPTAAQKLIEKQLKRLKSGKAKETRQYKLLAGENKGQTVTIDTKAGRFQRVANAPGEWLLRRQFKAEHIDKPDYSETVTPADLQHLRTKLAAVEKRLADGAQGSTSTSTRTGLTKTDLRLLQKLRDRGLITEAKFNETLRESASKSYTVNRRSKGMTQATKNRLYLEIQELETALAVAKAEGKIEKRLTAAKYNETKARLDAMRAKRGKQAVVSAEPVAAPVAAASASGKGGKGGKGRGARSNNYEMHRDNVGGSDILYGLGGFAGGLVGGVVATNALRRWMPATAGYLGYGVGALLAWDLYRSRTGQGMVFNRISNKGLRYGVAAGLILPMVARSLVSKILAALPGEFGEKIDNLLSAPASAPAALPAPTAGFGSVYDVAFDPSEDDDMSGMGRYVATSGMGRYVETSGLGLDVTAATAGMGLNVSEGAAGFGLDVSEAAAGMGRYVATSGMGEYTDGDSLLLQEDSGDLEGLGEDLNDIDEAPEMDDDDLEMEGLGANSVNTNVNKVVRATPAVVKRLKGFAGKFNLRILGPSKVARGAYIVSINRAKAESMQQALSTFPRQPSSAAIGPRPVADALRPGGIFAEPIFAASARHD